MSNENVAVSSKERSYRGYVKVDTYRLRHKISDDRWSGEMERQVVERGHAVAVLPYDPIRQELVLIEQFRIGAFTSPGFRPYQIECVAGIIEEGQTAEETAYRETLEETGLEAGALLPMVSYLSSPGVISEALTLFLGKVDATDAGGIFGVGHEDEHIRVFPVPLEDAFELLETGAIKNGMTVIALQWLKLNRHKIPPEWAEARE